MMAGFAPALGVLAGVVAVADTIPYVRDTLRGATRPHRGTWLIWGVLATVVCISQRADGASWSLIMAGAQAVVTCLVWVLSIRRGVGGVGVGEMVMVGMAMGGVIGWIVADEPIVATVCVVAADLIGAAMNGPRRHGAILIRRRSPPTRSRASVAHSLPAPSARSTQPCCCTRSTTAW